MRKIIHIDMDAYYAAIEQRDNPSLKGKPVVVSGPPHSRSVVCTCSYEARKYGIASAMPASQAYRRCPHAIFVKPRFPVYKEISKKIHQIFAQYTDLIEPLSLDEAYLDVSNCSIFKGSATLIANDIRRNIQKNLALTASAGISYNKMLAKIASDINKPNGYYVIPPDEAQAFIDGLPIGKFFGIGKKTAEKFINIGINTGADLKMADLKMLTAHFGKNGKLYYDIAHGIDQREVQSHRIRKSISSEITFENDIFDKASIKNALLKENNNAIKTLQIKNLKSKTITIKLRDRNFKTITKSHSVTPYFFDEKNSNSWINYLLEMTTIDNGIRLVGIRYSNLIDSKIEENQLSLFNP